MPSHQERRAKRYTCPNCGTSEIDGTHNVRMDDGRVACLIAVRGTFKGAFVPTAQHPSAIPFPPTSRAVN